MIRTQAVGPSKSGKAFEVVVRLAKADHAEGRDIIEAVEKMLLESIDDFAGRLTGPGECIFYVVGDHARLAEAVTVIAKEVGLGSQDIQVRSAKTLDGLGRRKSKQFDIFSVPLTNGLYGYVQKLDYDGEQGADLVRVYSQVSTEVGEISEIVRSGEMFPPVFTIISIGERKNGWRRIGRFPVEFEWPVFRQSPTSFFNPGVYADWYLWSKPDGMKLVGRLDESQRRFEFLCTWAPFALADRMATGVNPASEVK